MEYWYTLYTKRHCERQVQGALTAKGIETFFPCYLFARVEGLSQKVRTTATAV